MRPLFVAMNSEIFPSNSPHNKRSSVLKQLSKKESKLKTKPWITSAIRTSIKIKNKFYKKFLKTKSSYYQTKFKVYRNKLNHLIKISN